MSDSEGGPYLALDDMFTEPPRPPSPEPTTTVYTREAKNGPCHESYPWSTMEIRLVGSHPLWGHHLWNASRAFATYLDAHPELYRDRSVLELGAGGGLPGIVAAKNGARTVVLTDYPDALLLENLEYNVQFNLSPDLYPRVHVKGYIWGQAVNPLRQLQRDSADLGSFDLIILSDLIFNHSQHDALLRTCKDALSPSGIADAPEPCLLVFYSHHRPHLAHRDMQFFEKAREGGWRCEEILTQRFPPMFPEDPGEEEIRATVHGWRLTYV